MNATTERTYETFEALAVLVISPRLGRTLRNADPKAFEQAVKAYRAESLKRIDPEFAAMEVGKPTFACAGCSNDLSRFSAPFEAGRFRDPGLVTCHGCGGIVNTGFGDHIREHEFNAMFCGFEEPEVKGTPTTYYDIVTVDDNEKVSRHHGWFFTDKAGQRWICQTG